MNPTFNRTAREQLAEIVETQGAAADAISKNDTIFSLVTLATPWADG